MAQIAICLFVNVPLSISKMIFFTYLARKMRFMNQLGHKEDVSHRVYKDEIFQ